jgi:RimJ/RimL family protein N-acetyltransferase
MHHQGMIYWLGHYDSINETKVKIALERILQTGLDATWSARCKSLVDGKGAQRVADIISLGPETKLSAHRAHANDEALLLRWANDPLTRANAFNQNMIDQVTHQNWFFSRLCNPGRCQIFILKTENELPVGQVRFERMGQEWEIHYSIDPFVRKRGIGVNVLRSAISCFAASESVKLWGRVRLDNLASRRIFLKMGFVEEVGSQEIKYSLNINE